MMMNMRGVAIVGVVACDAECPWLSVFLLPHA